MTFYHRTLCHASGIAHAVSGEFIDKNQEDIIVSTGRVLKLLRLKKIEGEVKDKFEVDTLILQDTYNIICSLSKCRRKGESKDLIVITTDNGYAFILDIDKENMSFKLVCKCDFRDKTPRINPLYLSSDSQKGALSIAAAQDRIEIWFYGEDKKLDILQEEERAIIFDVTFVDINSENAIIAYLTVPYEKKSHPGQKYEFKREKPTLVFYEASMETKNVTSVKKIKCLHQANSLKSVPGVKGVLVFAENFIAFYTMDSSEVIKCPIPKRLLEPKDGVIIACSTIFPEKMQLSDELSSKKDNIKSICYLAQTEEGDIFKIELVVEDSEVVEIILLYYITLPVASVLCILDSGLLFVASEFGNHHFYRIADLEELTKCGPYFSSGMVYPKDLAFFLKRPMDIKIVAEIESLSPIMQMEFQSVSYNKKQMIFSTGRGLTSTIKIAKHGFDVTHKNHMKMEWNKDDDKPLHMWAIESTKSIESGEDETLVIVSYEFSTAVYSLERSCECFIKKIQTEFATQTNTIGCAKIGEDAIIQVCPEGIGHISGGRNNLIYDQSEKDGPIENYAVNKKSLVVACNKVLNYHEIDQDGRVKKAKFTRLLPKGFVNCMHLSDVHTNAELLAVGMSNTSFEPSSTGESSIVNLNTIHLFIVQPAGIQVLGYLEIENSPHSLLFRRNKSKNMCLLVGCKNGSVRTYHVEETPKKGKELAALEERKCEIIGSEPVQLEVVPLQVSADSTENDCVLAVTNNSWAKYSVDEAFDQLGTDLTSCFCILPQTYNHLPNGIATLSEDSLRLFTLTDLWFTPPPYPLLYIPSFSIPLEYTPKLFHFEASHIFVAESDPNSYTEETMNRKIQILEQHKAASQSGRKPISFPPPDKTPKSWASLLRVVSLIGESPTKILDYDNEAVLTFNQNEAILSFCLIYGLHDDILLVGVAKNFKLSNACCEEASVRVYKISKDRQTFRFVGEDRLQSAPLAMFYHEYLLIGSGRKLSIYFVQEDPFKLQLICEKKECVRTGIAAIYYREDRVLLRDLECGISCVEITGFPEEESRTSVPDAELSLQIIAKDIPPEGLTAVCFLTEEEETESEGKEEKKVIMARATKSRDIFIFELGALENRDTSKDYTEDEPSKSLSAEKLLACFHVGEVVTAMNKFDLLHNELDLQKIMVYATLSGSVGIFSMIRSKEDDEFLNSLNRAMIATLPEIDNRSHKLPLYSNFRLRNRHYKCENVIDGDFLLEFCNMAEKDQISVARAMMDIYTKFQEQELEDEEDSTEESKENPTEEDNIPESENEEVEPQMEINDDEETNVTETEDVENQFSTEEINKLKDYVEKISSKLEQIRRARILDFEF